MNYPKVSSVKAVDDHTLLVVFENAEKRLYDASPLFDREAFAMLRNWAFFKNVQVDKSGYGIYWNDEIDLSEYELLTNGTVVSN